jgi:hypothetical protein
VPSKSFTFDIFGRDVNASKTIRGVGAAATHVQAPFLKLGGIIAGAFAVDKIIGFAKTSVSAYAEAQSQEGKLADAVERYPALKGASLKALQSFNTELEHSTRFDDDALAVAEATLAQYGLNEAQLRKLTPLVADYAAKTGGDVTEASQTLGKALLGQGRALKGIGLNFKDTGSLAGNFGELVDGLSAKVGGFANKDVQNADGKLANLKNRFGDIEENIGQGLVPVLLKLADLTEKDVLPKVTNFSNWFSKEGGPALERYAPKIERFLVEVGQDVVGLVKAFQPLGGVALTGLGTVIHLVEDVDPTDLVTLGTAAVTAYSAFKLWGGLQPVISGVASALGAVAFAEQAASGWVGAIVGGVGLIAGAFIGAQQPSQDAVQTQQDYAAALEASNDAIDVNVRKLAAKKLQDEGALDAAGKLGISTSLLVDATIGNSGAQQELNDKVIELNKQLHELDQANAKAADSGGAQTQAAAEMAAELQVLTSSFVTNASAIDDQQTKNQQLKQATYDAKAATDAERSSVDGLSDSIRGIPTFASTTIAVSLTAAAKAGVLTPLLQRHASGGTVVGTGTWTSDSVPFLGSTGEEVIRSSAASRPGARPFLKAFNDDPSSASWGIGGGAGGDTHVHLHFPGSIVTATQAQLSQVVRNALVQGQKVGAIPKTIGA